MNINFINHSEHTVVVILDNKKQFEVRPYQTEVGICDNLDSIKVTVKHDTESYALKKRFKVNEYCLMVETIYVFSATVSDVVLHIMREKICCAPCVYYDVFFIKSLNCQKKSESFKVSNENEIKKEFLKERKKEKLVEYFLLEPLTDMLAFTGVSIVISFLVFLFAGWKLGLLILFLLYMVNVFFTWILDKFFGNPFNNKKNKITIEEYFNNEIIERYFAEKIRDD